MINILQKSEDGLQLSRRCHGQSITLKSHRDSGGPSDGPPYMLSGRQRPHGYGALSTDCAGIWKPASSAFTLRSHPQNTCKNSSNPTSGLFRRGRACAERSRARSDAGSRSRVCSHPPPYTDRNGTLRLGDMRGDHTCRQGNVRGSRHSPQGARSAERYASPLPQGTRAPRPIGKGP